MLLDLEILKEQAGLELLWGNVEAQYDEAIATINDNGGVLGRRIDPVYVYVDPLSETGYQEACVKLTEDEKVFAAIGFVRPADTALCYTETGDTPFLGYLTDITQDVFDRTVVSLVTTNPVPDRLDQAMVNVVADTGAADGKTIAVLGNDEERNQVVADELAARGFEVADQVVTIAPSDDEAADSAELDVIIERWASLGVDYVFATSSLDRPLAAAHRAGFEADWAVDEGSILSLNRFQSGATEAEMARTVVVQEPSVEVMYAAGRPADRRLCRQLGPEASRGSGGVLPGRGRARQSSARCAALQPTGNVQADRRGRRPGPQPRHVRRGRRLVWVSTASPCSRSRRSVPTSRTRVMW